MDRRSVGMVRQSPWRAHHYLWPVRDAVQRAVPHQQDSPLNLLRCLWHQTVLGRVLKGVLEQVWSPGGEVKTHRWGHDGAHLHQGNAVEALQWITAKVLPKDVLRDQASGFGAHRCGRSSHRETWLRRSCPTSSSRSTSTHEGARGNHREEGLGEAATLPEAPDWSASGEIRPPSILFM